MIWSYVLIWFVEKVEQVFEELIYASQFGGNKQMYFEYYEVGDRNLQVSI